MNRLAGAFIDLLFPQVRCFSCGEPRAITPGSALCDACTARLKELRIPEQACPHCCSLVKSGHACQYCADGGMQYLDAAYSPFMYREIAKELVVRLKFGPFELAAAPLAAAMAGQVSGLAFDALVPVPLSRSGERERGVNQSRVLCALISEQTGLPVLDVLKKTRHTKRQSSLPGAARPANVKGAFAARERADGLRILLVDDVRTTGSTARECARVLREAGAASVSLLTATVAQHREPHDG